MTNANTFLGLLYPQPNYGYELKRLYDHYFGKDKPMLSGQVYATLSRLHRDKMIAEIEDYQFSGGPERIRYALTEAGQYSVQQWLTTPEDPSPTLQTALYIKTVLAIIQDGDAAHYLDIQRRAHLERMRNLTNQKATAQLSQKLLIDHAIFHLEADLRWIDLTSARLTNLKEELCQPVNL